MTKLHICESAFDHPDKNAMYSFTEVDVFGYIPNGYYQKHNKKASEEPSFSMSVRKNLVNNEYELFAWHRADDESTKKVLFSNKSLKKVLKEATDKWHYYWDFDETNISDFELLACEHKYPHIDSLFCKIKN